MKSILLLLAVVTASAQEPPKYIWKTVRADVPTGGGASAIQRRMDVIDRTEDGALVRLYQLEKRLNERTFKMEDVRIDGEMVFIRGMDNGVGTTVSETMLYKTDGNTKIKGTVYHVYALRAPPVKMKTVDHDIQELNPLWTEWAAKERIRQSNEKTARVVTYQQQQAEKGMPSFQLELGRRYLRGDGVETNLALARHWLHAASTNGESQATNLLKQIPLQ